MFHQSSIAATADCFDGIGIRASVLSCKRKQFSWCRMCALRFTCYSTLNVTNSSLSVPALDPFMQIVPYFRMDCLFVSLLQLCTNASIYVSRGASLKTTKRSFIIFPCCWVFVCFVLKKVAICKKVRRPFASGFFNLKKKKNAYLTRSGINRLRDSHWLLR